MDITFECVPQEISSEPKEIRKTVVHTSNRVLVCAEYRDLTVHVGCEDGVVGRCFQRDST